MTATPRATNPSFTKKKYPFPKTLTAISHFEVVYIAKNGFVFHFSQNEIFLATGIRLDGHDSMGS